jgi:hypothetical protein
MTTEPDNDPYRPVYLGGPPGTGIAVPADVARQLALDEHDPDAMTDREERLRAELDHLDAAKLAGRIETLDHLRRYAGDVVRLGAAIDRAVAEARAYGATWQQIADAVGITRQSAHERWAR